MWEALAMVSSRLIQLGSVVFLGSAAAGATALAGVVGPIECGQVIPGSLDPSDTDLGDGTWLEGYEFTLRDQSTVSVLMTTDDEYVPYVIITDAELTTIEEGESPQIHDLPAGDYAVFANNLDVLPAGEYPYLLSLSCHNQEAHTLRCNEAVAGQLDTSDVPYTFDTWLDSIFLDIDTPSRVEIHFVPDGDRFDPYIFVRDSEQNEIGDGLDILSLELQPGEYSVFLNNYLPEPDGTYPYRVGAACEELRSCPGDCDGDGTVSISELVRGVRLALGPASDDACDAFDRDGNGEVSVNELIAAVGAALDGC